MFKNYLNMVPKPIGLLFTKIAIIFTILKPDKIDPFINSEAIYKTFSYHPGAAVKSKAPGDSQGSPNHTTTTFSFHDIQIWNHMSVNIKIGTYQLLN